MEKRKENKTVSGGDLLDFCKEATLFLNVVRIKYRWVASARI